MPKHSRRFQEIASKVNHGEEYAPDEAIRLVKETATAKFDETVEVHLRMGVDPRHADQQVRGVVTLPAGTGSEVRILVFASPEGQAIAEEAGADHVGGEGLAEQIKKGWLDFDLVLATPDMMRVVGQLGRVLGPRGLMPSPKAGTIVQAEDLPRVIEEARLGRIEFRVDKTANIHVPIGKASFSHEDLLKNFSAFMEAIMAARPASTKNIYVQRVTVTSTMGPGIKMDVNEASALKVQA